MPAVLLLADSLLNLHLASGLLLGEMLAYSLLYGGIPYAGVATVATVWVGRQREEQIRSVMYRAPLLMTAVFVPLALILGLVVGEMTQFAAVAVLGVVVILLLGYGYVALTVLLRRACAHHLKEESLR